MFHDRTDPVLHSDPTPSERANLYTAVSMPLFSAGCALSRLDAPRSAHTCDTRQISTTWRN